MKFGIIGNTAKSSTKDVLKNLLTYLRKKRLAFVLHNELGSWLRETAPQIVFDDKSIVSESDLPNQCDMLIALGGDGTMLSAARIVGNHEIPILGVNLGKLGFLAEVSVDELQQCLNDVLEGKYLIEERMVLQATSNQDTKVYFALNEIVIDRGASPRMIDLETSVNGDYLVTYTADGIILTTPTGSTAYSLASNGPIVTPQSRVVIINPIAPHTLTARPVVVPEDSTIRVVAKSTTKTVHLTADGQREGFYETPVEIFIRKAEYSIQLVKRQQRTFFDVLRTKLMWGRDLRVEKH